MSSSKLQTPIYSIISEVKKIDLGTLHYRKEIEGVVKKYPADLWYFLWRASENTHLGIIKMDIPSYKQTRKILKAVENLNVNGIPVKILSQKHFHDLSLKLETDAKKIFKYIYSETTLIRDISRNFDKRDLLSSNRFNKRFHEVFTFYRVITNSVKSYIPQTCKACAHCDIENKLCLADLKNGEAYDDFDPSEGCFELKEFSNPISEESLKIDITKAPLPSLKITKGEVNYQPPQTKRTVELKNLIRTDILKPEETEHSTSQRFARDYINKLLSNSKDFSHEMIFSGIKLPLIRTNPKLIYKILRKIANSSRPLKFNNIYPKLPFVQEIKSEIRDALEATDVSCSYIMMANLKILKAVMNYCVFEYIKEMFFHLVERRWIVQINSKNLFVPESKKANTLKPKKDFFMDYRKCFLKVPADKLNKILISIKN